MHRNLNSLCLHIDDVLHYASDCLIEDTALQAKLRVKPQYIKSEVDRIVGRLSQEMRDICILEKDERPPKTEESFETTAGRNPYDIYVVLPIFNATDEQAAACINSIVKNFASFNFCLVLYSNRPWRQLPELLSRAIPVIEFRSPAFSLPFAYNTCMEYLRREFNAIEELTVFMDDDAAIFDNQQEFIARNIASIQNEEVLAVSGHYFDDREPENLFQSAINYTNCTAFASRCLKPYCHGGAVLMMKAKSYPANGLPLEGLGGISLSVLMINSAGDHYLMRSGWFLRNTPQLKVFHPRKQNLVQWTTTYLSYEIAWKRALSWLDASKRSLWDTKLKETSSFRTQLLINDINGEGSDALHAMSNLLLTKYYKPLLSRYFLYGDFASLDLQTHSNLLESNVEH